MNSLTAAHIAANKRLRVGLAAGITSTWQSLPDYSDAGAARFVKTVTPLVLSSQRSSAQLTAAYLARRAGSRVTRVDLAKVTGAGVRAGAAPAEVYRRPFVTVWTALGNGASPPDALAAGLARAVSTAAMDVQLAMRATVAEVSDADPAIDGYFRVPDPGACALCVLASQQRYHSGDLMPIHNGCGCGIEPYVKGRKAETVSSDTLETAQDAGIEPVVQDHGELGPVLGKAGDSFTQL